MIPLITLVDPILTSPSDPDDIDPEDAILAARFAGFRDDIVGSIAAHAAHIPIPESEDGKPLGWSIREVRHLRFLRRLVDEGGFAGDRFGEGGA